MEAAKQHSWMALVIVAMGISVLTAPAQDQPAAARGFSLAERAWVVLTSNWVERENEAPPPPFLLVASAPPITFTDILTIENRKALSVVKLGISENPFFGSNPADLDARIQSALVQHLFYFFFPPPRNCLATAKAEVEAAWRKEQARAAAESDEKEKRPPKPVSVIQWCDFSSTPQDFYSSQVSPGFALSSTGRAQPSLRRFYIAPTESMELAGKTFYIFEARGELMVDRAELDKFNLPEEMRGARAHFFWAVGADNPFPFVRDPLRKNVQIFHVVYATLSSTGTAIADFREKLRGVRFAP